MKKYLSLLAFLMIIAPSVAFASWWNPFSWGIFSSVFHSSKETQVVVSGAMQKEAPKATSTEATSTPSSTSTPLSVETDMTLCNGQYYKKCETGQLLVCPTDAKVEAYCSIPKTPKVISAIQSAQVTSKPKNTPIPPQTTIEVKSQSTTNAQSPDFKPQVISLIIAAKENYVELVKYADECASTASNRKSSVELLVMNPSKSDTLSSVAFDPYLTKIYTIFYQLGELEISNMEKYRIFCGVTTRDSLSNNINILDGEIVKIKNYNKQVTSEDLAAYQVAYFGPANSTETYRTNIKGTIDKMSREIPETNAGYSLALSKVDSYLKGVLSPTANINSYIPPPPLTLPQMPKTTNCTISGDGGVGLQAYVNCTTY